MTLQDVLNKTVQFFKEKNLDSPRLDAELLLSKAMGLRRIDLYLKFDKPLDPAEVDRCRDLVKRRSQGEPVAYILGEKEFYGFPFQVDSRVLIPRPETELLAEAGIEVLKGKETPEVLDLGCGSGCLGLSIAKKIPHTKVTLVDISPEALEVAKVNGEKLELNDRCTYVLSDAVQAQLQNEKFDLIVANPPYIEKGDARVEINVDKYEPKLALYAGDQGLRYLKEWSECAMKFLKPGGTIGFEFGSDQAEAAQAHFQKLNLKNIRIIKDLAGHSRHILAEKEI